MSVTPEADARLEMFLQLPADWDGEDADPITPVAVETARKVITRAGGPDYEVFPVSGGGILIDFLNPENNNNIDFWIDHEGKEFSIVCAGGTDERTYETCETTDFDNAIELLLHFMDKHYD